MTFSKPRRAVSRVFIHCSASNHAHHDDVRWIRDFHVNEKGWSDVGYHNFITFAGVNQPGRPLERVPAAQGVHNRGSIAICLHGLHEEDFTEAQFKTLREYCQEINDAYNGNVTFHGHREVAPKACPVFDYKAVLNLDSMGRLGFGDVERIADEVEASGSSTPAYGNDDEFVKAFQRKHGLVVDGDPGPKTYGALNS